MALIIIHPSENKLIESFYNQKTTNFYKNTSEFSLLFDRITYISNRCPKMNTTQRYLVSPAEIAHALSKRSKNDHIRRIIELVGEDRAGLLLLKFAGETISFPRKSSLWRIAKAEYIQKELRPFRKNPHEFKIKVRKLSRLLKMSRPSVIRTLESGRYSE